MTISYVANIRLPTEKAHGYQIMRVCSQWASMGHTVTLFVPQRANHISEDAFAYYGLTQNFTVAYVPCAPWMSLVPIFGRFAFFMQSLSFLRAAAPLVPKNSTVYTRDREAVWYLSRRGLRCVLNAHTWPHRSWFAARLAAAAKGAVCNSKGTEAAVRAATALPTIVAYNASDANEYAGKDKTSLRQALGLPVEKKIVLYSGHLYGWKGSDAFVRCARICEQRSDWLFVSIGGTPGDVALFQEKTRGMPTINFLGHQPKALVPKFLASADVLLLPNTQATAESVRFTSPLKMFEYMAAGVPIVASDLPSIREILTDRTAFFANAGSAESLAEAVAHVLEHPEEGLAKAQAALTESAAYSWGAHAERVVSFIASVAG